MRTLFVSFLVLTNSAAFVHAGDFPTKKDLISTAYCESHGPKFKQGQEVYYANDSVWGMAIVSGGSATEQQEGTLNLEMQSFSAKHLIRSWTNVNPSEIFSTEQPSSTTLKVGDQIHSKHGQWLFGMIMGFRASDETQEHEAIVSWVHQKALYHGGCCCCVEDSLHSKESREYIYKWSNNWSVIKVKDLPATFTLPDQNHYRCTIL